jgi:hypothetical protein
MIIAIGGKQRSGKTTVVNELMKQVRNPDLWIIISTSDIVMQGVASKYQISINELRANKDKHRAVLQEFSDNNPGYVLDEILQLMTLYPDRNFIVDSVRRQKEAETLAGFHATFLLVTAPDALRRERAGGVLTGSDHPTETEAFEFLYDHRDVYHVLNDTSLIAVGDRLREVLGVEVVG